jgi:mRNA interferase MazF
MLHPETDAAAPAEARTVTGVRSPAPDSSGRSTGGRTDARASTPAGDAPRPGACSGDDERGGSQRPPAQAVAAAMGTGLGADRDPASRLLYGIRGAVYRVDLGEARRGHELRGRRYGLVLSPTDMAWSVVTIVPTSTKAQPAVFRPEIELGGVPTRFLVDQLRSIDVRFVDGEPAFFLHRDELEDVEVAVTRYLGL